MAYTTIDKPSKYFNTLTWTGNGATSRSLTGVGFKPDFLWVKCRNQATFSHTLSDAVRGSTKTLFSNLTNAEINNYTYGYVTSYDTDGFSATAGASSIEQYNTNADTYVGWNWLASNTTASNTAGSITSTVSANTTSGFSIVSFTTTSGGNATIGHGLGSVPKMIIMKSRTNTYNWDIYHVGIGNANRLVFTSASSGGTPCWGSTTPTSSVFTMDQSFYGSGLTTIAYCFAEVKGFSKAFSYTGNGSTDGSFTYCGFSPAFIMIKRTDSADAWFMYDNKRNTSNVVNKFLQANLSDAEGTYTFLDMLSNGFKARTIDGSINASGGTYIGIAFASNPFVSSKGIVANAR